MELKERDYLVTGRSVTLSLNGIASSASPLAAQVGAYILKDGGNAFDAAVAMAATEDVVCTPFCGIGGDVFALLYEASSAKVYGVTGNGKAPGGMSIKFFRDKGYEKIPTEGALSTLIPGEVDALWGIYKRFGSGHYTFPQLLEPAIEFAEKGFPMGQRLARYFRSARERIDPFPSTVELVTSNGAPYRPGQVMVQKKLARTLRRIAEGGPDEFYRGELARELIQALREAGSPYTPEELGAHETVIYDDPMSDTYRGHTIYETRLPSRGMIVLQAMNMLEQFDISSLGFNTPDYIHLLTEVRHKVFADLKEYYGDPEYVDVPAGALLSKEYARERAGTIDMKRAANHMAPGVLTKAVGANGSTTYFCVADRQGNLVSFIHSLFGTFGQGIGIEVPLRPLRHQVIMLHRPQDLLPEHPTVGDLINKLSFRPDSTNLTLIGYGEEEEVDIDTYNQGVDTSVVSEAFSLLTRRCPLMAQAYFRGGWSGLFDVTPDGTPFSTLLKAWKGSIAPWGLAGTASSYHPWWAWLWPS